MRMKYCLSCVRRTCTYVSEILSVLYKGQVATGNCDLEM